MNFFVLTLLLSLASRGHAHFVLQIPTSLGFNDINEAQGPCGGFDITNRDKVTDWPIAGYPIGVVSTHPDALWQVRAALLDAPDDFVDLIPNIRQNGMGNFCLKSVPGYEDWIGKDAVLQVVQTAVDGQLFQCAAIKFVDAAAASVPGNCRNASNIVASIDPEYTGTAVLPVQTPGTPTTATGGTETTGSAGPTTTTGTSGANKGFDLPLLGLFALQCISWIF